MRPGAGNAGLAGSVAGPGPPAEPSVGALRAANFRATEPGRGGSVPEARSGRLGVHSPGPANVGPVMEVP